MRRVLRALLSPATPDGRVMLPAEFHVRRSHSDRSGRAAVHRRLHHKRVDAVSPAHMYRPVHTNTSGTPIGTIWGGGGSAPNSRFSRIFRFFRKFSTPSVISTNKNNFLTLSLLSSLGSLAYQRSL